MKPAEGSTVIGKSVTIHGELLGSEDLFMDGTLDGSIQLTECRLTIGPNARIKANISVRDLIVFGHVDGNIQASGRLELRQAAIVNGDIVASRLSVEETSTIKGQIELTGSSASA
jgi:cytoskeletal protein CcmA (bactofilin family)